MAIQINRKVSVIINASDGGKGKICIESDGTIQEATISFNKDLICKVSLADLKQALLVLFPSCQPVHNYGSDDK